MQIYRSIEEAQIDCPTVITVGTFDGLHLGHQQIIDRLREQAEENDCLQLLITFHPHPKTVVGLQEKKKIQLLTTLDEKLDVLEKLKVQATLVIPFTQEFSQTSYQDFVKKILFERLKVRAMVIGYDHAFGHNRQGHPEQLKAISRELGFSVTVVEPYIIDGEIVSSTRIREYLFDGQVEKANKLLGRPYSLHGKVIKGDRRGHVIGFPTANIHVENPYKLIPRQGVYAVDVYIERKKYRGMMNIGYRPTFNFDPLTLETHIINFSGSLYNKPIEVEFLKFVREEKKFFSENELRKQLIADKKICSEI